MPRQFRVYCSGSRFKFSSQHLRGSLPVVASFPEDPLRSAASLGTKHTRGAEISIQTLKQTHKIKMNKCLFLKKSLVSRREYAHIGYKDSTWEVHHAPGAGHTSKDILAAKSFLIAFFFKGHKAGWLEERVQGDRRRIWRRG